MKTKRSEIDIVACCRDVQQLGFDESATMKDMFAKFYSVLEEYGVCQWQKELDEDGNEHTTGNTMEWIMCKTSFIENNISFMFTMYDMINPIPEAIKCFELEEE